MQRPSREPPHARPKRAPRVTPAEAQAMQDDARGAGRWLMWFVSYEHTGKFIARAHVTAPDNGLKRPAGLAWRVASWSRGRLPVLTRSGVRISGASRCRGPARQQTSARTNAQPGRLILVSACRAEVYN